MHIYLQNLRIIVDYFNGNVHSSRAANDFEMGTWGTTKWPRPPRGRTYGRNRGQKTQ